MDIQSTGKRKKGKKEETSMEQLPDDIIAEIFSFLPLKAAIKSKCLSTRLNKIISEKSFTVKLSTRSKSLNETIVFNHSSYQHVFFHIISPPNHQSYEELSPMPTVYTSSNGLLLLGFATPTFGDVFCVCNPITRNYQLIKLILPKDSILRNAGLAIDTNNNECLLSPKYKVVAISLSSKGCVFHTFRSEKQTWTETLVPKENWQLRGFEMGTKAIYVNGHLHWLQFDGDVVAFNVEKENVRIIKGPSKLNPYYKKVFGEFQGRVRIIMDIYSKHVMYTLHDYEGERWTVGSEVGYGYDPVLLGGERCVSRKSSTRELYAWDGNDMKHPRMIGELISFMDGNQCYYFFDPTLVKVSTIDYIEETGQKVEELNDIKESINKLIKMLASSI